MRFLKLFLVAAVLYYGYQKWHEHKLITNALAEAPATSSGFMSVAMPDGAQQNQVLIFAPLNCPSEAAQRADALSAKLNQMGIPNARSAHFQMSFTSPSDLEQAAVVRTGEVMKGEVPTVFVNGMGKANPTLDEVVAEFQRTKH